MQLTLLASFLERSSLQKIAFPFRTKGLFSTEPWHDRRQVNSVCPEALWKDVKRIYVIGKRAKVDLQETSRYFQLISLELSYIITTHHSHNNMRMRAWICWSQVQNEVLIHAQIIPGFIKQSIQFRKNMRANLDTSTPKFAAQAGPGRVQLMARAVGLNVRAPLFVVFWSCNQVKFRHQLQNSRGFQGDDGPSKRLQYYQYWHYIWFHLKLKSDYILWCFLTRFPSAKTNA